MVKRRISIQVLIIIIILCIFSSLFYFGEEIFWDKEKTKSDSQKYYNTLSYFRGENTDYVEKNNNSVFSSRFLVPFMALPLSYFLSFGDSFALINVMFTFLTAIILWFFCYDLFKDRRIADFSAIAYPLSLVVFAYGSRPLIDTASFFMIILIMWFVNRMNFEKVKDYVYSSLILMVGFLIKESTFHMASIFFIVVLCEKKYKFISKLFIWFKLIGVIFISTIPALIWQRYSHSSWFAQRSSFYRFQDGISLRSAITALWILIFRSAIAFHILFLPFCYGTYILYREKKDIFKKFMMYSFPAFFLIFTTWLFAPPFSPRFVHFAFYIIIPISIYGLIDFTKKLGWSSNSVIIIFLIIYGFISLIGALMFPSSPVVDGNTNLLMTGLHSLVRRFGF